MDDLVCGNCFSGLDALPALMDEMKAMRSKLDEIGARIPCSDQEDELYQNYLDMLTAITIKHYYDINTNKHNTFFVDNASKELNLFYLHLLCNMNFVKHILRPLFLDGNTWVFRVEYVVTYYTFRALQRLKNYCENNTDIVVDTREIGEILSKGDDLFQSKFRNCMMHYNLQDQGVLSLEYIEKPFFGIIETCFGKTDYQTYLSSLHKMADRIIVYLERHFNSTRIELKQED